MVARGHVAEGYECVNPSYSPASIPLTKVQLQKANWLQAFCSQTHWLQAYCIHAVKLEAHCCYTL
jgi:hypothetical protein